MGRGRDGLQPGRTQLTVHKQAAQHQLEPRGALPIRGPSSPQGSATHQAELGDREGRFWLSDVVKAVSGLLFCLCHFINHVCLQNGLLSSQDAFGSGRLTLLSIFSPVKQGSAFQSGSPNTSLAGRTLEATHPPRCAVKFDFRGPKTSDT